MKSRTFRLGVAAAAAIAGGSVANAQPVIWNNGPAAGPGGFSSQLNAGPNSPFESQTADDFQLAAAMFVTDVHWTGVYFNLGGTTPPLGQAFNIEFYADNGTGTAPTGGPGDPTVTALATYNTGVGGAGEVVGAVAGTFDYSFILPTPFVALPGVHYWISIQSINAFPPQWAWSTSTLDQLSEGRIGSTGALALPFWSDPATATTDDLAYSLTGIPVPAPGALALLGLAGLVGSRRRRA